LPGSIDLVVMHDIAAAAIAADAATVACQSNQMQLSAHEPCSLLIRF